MRICIATPLYPPSIGGPATYSKLVHSEFSRFGIETKIVSFDGVRKYPVLIRHFLYLIQLARASKDCSLIFSLDISSVGLPATIVAKLFRKKLVFKFVGDFVWEQAVQRGKTKDNLDQFSSRKFFANPVILLFRYGQAFLAFLADHVIVPSEYLKKIIMSWPIKPRNVSVIYNSFSLAAVQDNGVKSNDITLLSAGRLVPWKGFLGLIDAVSSLVIKYPQLKLLIAGEGPDRSVLELRIKELHLENNVELLGQLDKNQLHTLMAQARIFILNTEYEGLSHILLEAMALGTPIITTPVGGNVELIENNKNGILVQPGDTPSLERAIVDVLSDPGKAEFFALKSKEKIANFTEAKMLEKTSQLILSFQK